MKVGLSRLGTFVAQPEGDRADADARPEHPHSRGVAQRVRMNCFVLQARAGSGAIEAKLSRDRIATKRFGAALSSENGVTWEIELAKFAADSGLEITDCHLPPGSSKWN